MIALNLKEVIKEAGVKPKNNFKNYTYVTFVKLKNIIYVIIRMYENSKK